MSPFAHCSATALAAAVLASAVVVAPAFAAGAPVRPTDDALVLATVPPALSAGSAYRVAERALADAPDDPVRAAAFARLAVEAGRARSDPRFYGRAAAALEPWRDAADAPRPIRVLRAVILQAEHDFAAALALLDALVAEDPADPQPRLSRAGVRFTIGEPAAAAEDCAAVTAAGAVLPGAVCAARLAALTGRAAEGVDGLAAVLALDGRADDTQRAFASAVLADIAAGLGRADTADALHAAAVARDPAIPLLVAAAEHDLDRGRPAAALDRLATAPDQDAVLLLKLRAAQASGDTRAAAWEAVVRERFDAAAAAGNRVHLREEARFRLDVDRDADRALALAVENWTVQKEVVDARLLLEAALAAGRPEAAAPVVDHIRATGLSDVRLAPLLARLAGEAS